jgi:O-methyltransferase
VPGDIDAIVRENARLTDEVRQLRERISALESSRWWRLHPRFLLRGRARSQPHDRWDASPHERFPLDFDDADADLYNRVASRTMTPPARIYALARAVEYVAENGVPGALVECGVWRGGSMMAVALTLLRVGVTDRDLFLFDTFSGMPPAGEQDVNVAGTQAAEALPGAEPDSRLRAAAELDDVRTAMLELGYPEGRIHFVAGPVEKTLPRDEPERIALLRLDTDWYASTKHELVHLYPRLVPGGVLILDDYGYWRGARQAVDEFLRENDVPLLLNRIDNSARIAVKSSARE